MMLKLLLPLLLLQGGAITLTEGGQKSSLASLEPKDGQTTKHGGFRSDCVTGTMTDIQSWVSLNGSLAADIDAKFKIDLSLKPDPSTLLQEKLNAWKSFFPVQYLSLARCRLRNVPRVFHYSHANGSLLSDTLKYLSLYGNNFSDTTGDQLNYAVTLNATNGQQITLQQSQTLWDFGFKKIEFPNLTELDLRRCMINTLSDNTFEVMPNLKILYLSQNNIISVKPDAFANLSNLKHLDLSRNRATNWLGRETMLTFESGDVLKAMPYLQSLDLSHTKLRRNIGDVFRGLGPNFRRLSICWTGLNSLKNAALNNTSLSILDVSGNQGILESPKVFEGLENTLKVLYADSVGLDGLVPLENLTALEVLRLSNNQIGTVLLRFAESMKNLKILDLDNNRIVTWHLKTFGNMKKLKILSLRNNNINLIKDTFIQDLENVKYISLSGNFFVCSCASREFFQIAAHNEQRELLDAGYRNQMQQSKARNTVATFHTGFCEYYDKVASRRQITYECDKKQKSTCKLNYNASVEGNFLLFDYDASDYVCLDMDNGKMVPFANIKDCNASRKDDFPGDVIKESWNKLIIIGIVGVVLVPLLLICIWYRRSFTYFFISVKNSAVLSLISKSDGTEDGTIFHYDVFVSYCNDDRVWVLDHLLPHLERHCNISVCLHERDFQVGLSILENIVSCMDKSKSIMLVISQKFLLSQWCQFEMHLAQHRLLETRREDLILILLEDIPRRLRPNTLHYLMLTKTYVVWPEDKGNEAMFWRRLKRSFVTQNLKSNENISFA